MKSGPRLSTRRSTGTVSTFLTLTSLVDLFTNLVLFLLYNFSAEGSTIPSAERLKLPQSVTEQRAETTVTVMVTQSDIFLGGRRITDTGSVMKTDELLIPDLKKELDFEAKRGKYFASLTPDTPFEGRITILGDKHIPFRLLEKVMFTCSEAEFGQIDLGVLHKELT
ncbi:MAG TPA: biopolymer transporter ExbD [Nitrospiria bacterium]|nr:biopolymer transporter ExbD [Nitrospiria bacterium]